MRHFWKPVRLLVVLLGISFGVVGCADLEAEVIAEVDGENLTFDSETQTYSLDFRVTATEIKDNCTARGVRVFTDWPLESGEVVTLESFMGKIEAGEEKIKTFLFGITSPPADLPEIKVKVHKSICPEPVRMRLEL